MIPPLFDSRINLTTTSNGQDYGNYKSDEVNALVDEAARRDRRRRTRRKALQEADDQLGEDVAYIPLEITRFYFLHGSKVTNYMTTPASNRYPDLGAIGVKK